MPNANILFQNQPTAPLTAHFNDAMSTAQNFNDYKQMPVRNRLLDAQAQGAEIGNQSELMNQEGAQFQLERKKQLAQVADMASDAAELLPILQGGDQFQLYDKLTARVEKIRARGGDPSDTIDFMERLQNGVIDQEQAATELGSIINNAQQLGVYGSPQTAAIRDFEAKAKAAGLEKGTPEYAKAARVDLGLDARAGMSAEERIALDKNIGQKVIEQKAGEAGAVEQAKLKEQLEISPKIEEAKLEVTNRVEKVKQEMSQLNRYQDAQALYSSLIPDGSIERISSIYGKGESLYPKLLRSQDGINAMAERDQLISMLQLGARGELKGQGPITENEQAILSKAITLLSEVDISPKLAARELKSAMDILAKNAGVSANQANKPSNIDDLVKKYGN